MIISFPLILNLGTTKWMDTFEHHWQFLVCKYKVQGVPRFYEFMMLPWPLRVMLLQNCFDHYCSIGTAKACRYFSTYDDGTVAVAGEEAAQRGNWKVKEDLVRIELANIIHSIIFFQYGV